MKFARDCSCEACTDAARQFDKTLNAEPVRYAEFDITKAAAACICSSCLAFDAWRPGDRRSS